MKSLNLFANCGCNRCGKTPCACPEPIFSVKEVSGHPSVLQFNVNGKTVTYDYEPLVRATQTDTSLGLDRANRVLKYSAERHIDTLRAQDLGSIFHLGDLGDVTTKGAANGSMLVYQRDDTCGAGCVGDADVWHIWNALDTENIKNSLAFLTGTDSDGLPITLGRPTNPNQTYLLGWNGNSQISYFQPAIVTTPPANGYQLYMDSNRQLVAVEVK